ncbi:hypothetical protein KDA23_02345 [Candidatus Saccharibacteria bacterium]|nr:hypothetical protein [Candidatus Saccharibacteria bacterium]
MRLIVLYRPRSEHGRTVETFIQDYKYRHGDGRMEILDIDSRDGSATAMLYDVMQYPAILALANDGSVLQMWQGDSLPLMDEVASYTLNAA